MERYHSNDQFGDACDLDALLHPSQAFGHPSEVVSHPDLTVNEKRAILASWASDHCAACLEENALCTSMRSWMRYAPSTKRRRSRTSPDRRLPERPRKVSRGSPDEGCDHSLS